MNDTKKKILLEILNEQLYKEKIIDKETRDKVLASIWK